MQQFQLLFIITIVLLPFAVLNEAVVGDSRGLLQVGSSEEAVTVASEADLRAILLGPPRKNFVRLSAAEIRLSRPLIIQSPGISIAGAENGTFIRCPPEGEGGAFVIKRELVFLLIFFEASHCRGGPVELTSLNITGCRSHSAVVVERESKSNEATLNVTFENVNFISNGEGGHISSGAAVHAEPCQGDVCMQLKLAFHSCHFDHNHARLGGAVYAEDADILMNQSSFLNNEAVLTGGALYFDSEHIAQLSLVESLFTNNRALEQNVSHGLSPAQFSAAFEMKRSGLGGAVFARNPAALMVRRVNFTGNVGCRGGGALTVVQDRRAMGVNETQDFNISYSVFGTNRAYCDRHNASRLDDVFGYTYYGGGLLQDSGETPSSAWMIRDSQFLENEAAGGGAISFRSQLTSAAEHSIISCDFVGNVGLLGGGSLSLVGSRSRVMNSRFRNGKAPYGGGIGLRQSAALAFVQDPANSSAVSVIEGTVAVNGGGIFVRSGSVNLTALVVRNNTAYRNGGGIRILNTDEACILRGIQVIGNRAYAGGGIAVLGSSDVTITGLGDQKSVIENNTAAAGGGLYYDLGEALMSFVTIEKTRFAANGALSPTSPEMLALEQEADEYIFARLSRGKTSSIEEEVEDGPVVPNILIGEIGHGGGIAVNLLRFRSFTVLEITLANISIQENVAVVGGGFSVQTTRLLAPTENRILCSRASVGFEGCLNILFHNVAISQNQAEFAGGLFSSVLDVLAFSCSPESVTWSGSTHAPSIRFLDELSQFCTDISKNAVTGQGSTQGADVGTRAAKLAVEGWDGPLQRLASGETLAIPCKDHRDSSCPHELKVAVQDAFGQTITGGIEDSGLELILSSEAIEGDRQYRAEKGIAVIDNTRAHGIDASSTLMISSRDDREIQLELQLTTRECYPGEFNQTNRCVACAVDKYGFIPSNEKCESCEDDAICSGGAVLVPMEGHWHSIPFSPILCECINSVACDYEGRGEKLTAFYEDPAKLQTQLNSLDAFIEGRGPEPDFQDYQQCADGYGGPLCGSCESGYGHSYAGNCEACPKEEATGARLFLVAGWLFVFIGFNCAVTLMTTNARVACVKAELQDAARNRRRALRRAEHVHSNAIRSSRLVPRQSAISDGSEMTNPSQRSTLTQQLMAAIVLTETLKILVNYLQITSTALRLQTRWNKLLSIMLQLEAGWVGFLSGLVSTPYECGFKNGTVPESAAALWMRLATPWIVLVALELAFVLLWICMKFRRQFKQQSTTSRSWLSRDGLQTCLVVIAVVAVHFSFIDVVRELMRAVNCVDMAGACTSVSAEHPYRMYSLETDGKRVWAEDTSQVCFEGSHLPLGIVGIVGLVFSFSGIISIILWLPLNKKHAGKSEFIARYWFIYQAYRNEWYTAAWESTVLVRKSMIAAVVVFTVQLNPILQAATCAGVLTAAVVLQAIFTPFKIPEEQLNVPDYAGDIFRYLHAPKLGQWWVQFNNSIHLNIIETVSLAASASVFYAAIVLQDSSSSAIGRMAMSGVSFAINAAFLSYVLYRLYAGLHVLLDLKLELSDAAFMATHGNSIGVLSLATKARALFRVWRSENAPGFADMESESNSARESYTSVQAEEIGSIA